MGGDLGAKGEVFRSSGSVVIGTIGLAMVALVVVLGVVEQGSGFPLWGYALCGFLATLIWAAILRPRIRVAGEDLELRGFLDTVTVPLAAVSGVVVHQVAAVRVGERRYVSAAVNRTFRQSARELRGKGRPGAPPSYGSMVENRIRKRADDARAQRGIPADSDEQWALGDEVRRTWAWPEIALLAGFALVVVVTGVL
ncbi:hypothetical protein [Nocardioides sp. YIM 152588]|uniref:hypothetical protein n=1 Tax=Nocardioides sp. YIM 152588 TaxID=3158259 RepID=UPI0032E4A992